MSFDWSDYLAFAQKLQASTEEAEIRSAISRAYYCVFHKAKVYAVDHLGYTFRPDQPSHLQMWRAFEGKGRTFKAVYDKGVALKRCRQDADYDADVEPKSVEYALSLAQATLTYLAQLPES